MWGEVVVVTPPDGLSPTPPAPLTIEQARRQARVDGDYADAELTDAMAAAIDHVEAVTNTRLRRQVVSMAADGWADLARLPVAPVHSATVRYIDPAGDEQTLDAAIYEARLEGLAPGLVLRHGRQSPARQPGSRLMVEAVVGYDVAPPAVVAALKILTADLFEFRQSASSGAVVQSETAATVEALLCNHQIHLL